MPEKAVVPAKCLHCGKEFLAYKTAIKNGKGKYCSHRCSNYALGTGKKTGPDSTNWKGGRYVNSQGYVCIHIKGKRYIQEHRLVMENHLGRKLLTHENIHHINGNTLDNRIENLQVVTSSQHATLHHKERTGGRWAKGNDFCIRCKRSDRKHAAKGLCESCYVTVHKKR